MTAESRGRNDDIGLLIALYRADPTAPDKSGRADAEQKAARRPPWTWSLLKDPEAAALNALVAGFVESYNEVHASRPRLLVPRCWRLHPGLATELAVLTWTWYAVHRDPAATAVQAAEYYLRYLPGFQSRLDEMLGRSPMECRQGNHPSSWRRDVDAHNTAYGMSMPFSEKQVIDELRRQQFGFGSSTQG